MKVKFMLFADLHVDMMHDGVMRAQVIAEAAVRHRADSLIFQETAPDLVALASVLFLFSLLSHASSCLLSRTGT